MAPSQDTDEDVGLLRIGLFFDGTRNNAHNLARGRPQHPSELVDAPVVMAATSVLLTDWQFVTADGPLTLRPPSRFVVSSNNAAIHAARLGAGYTRVLSYQAAEAVARGELEIVLDAFATAPLPIHLLYQDGARLPAKVRSFVDHCAARLRANPALQAAMP